MMNTTTQTQEATMAISGNLPTHFEPSSSMLMDMIASAERACDSDCEQEHLKSEARSDARMERFWIAQAAAMRWRKLYGR